MRIVRLSLLFIAKNYKVNIPFMLILTFALSVFLVSVIFKEVSIKSVISVLDRSGHMLVVVPTSAVEEIEKTGDVIFTNSFIPEDSLSAIASIYDKAIEAGWRRKGGFVSQPGIGEGGKAKEVLQPPTWSPRLYQYAKVKGEKMVVAGVDFRKEYEVRLWWDLKDGMWPFDIADSYAALIGENVHEKMKLNVYDTITINNTPFKVYGILKRIGTEDDNMIFIPLKTAQNIFNKKGLVSMFAVRAMCDFCPVGDALIQINKSIAGISVLSQQDISKAQYYFREVIYKYLQYIGLTVILFTITMLYLLAGWYISRNAKDLALLKAFGAKFSDMLMFISINILLLTLLSSLLGYALSLAIVYSVCSISNIYFLYTLNLYHILLSNVVGLAISFISVFLRLLKFSKMSFIKLYNYGGTTYG
ncbi:protein of unknown function DUF214 [Hydrogenobacter thermophilus TK-6]|uniref:ABC transporter permease protein n=1 Tax=Hydrogenobacter thermophilus (strain DSM 6534 / IAM 12695 / TK-6) TaxID=608538 RepID=D3DI29_HYDTT|nr:ABC transporter permease [Hydrogenobacter thermophilus]ADO45413.1 protein of unknown function DUF214 [Hydrogenobacter thermophilus TK-6]BAI69481.1 ABC transporter permease protein [Hydrogenobacter thermophilus TK-6]